MPAGYTIPDRVGSPPPGLCESCRHHGIVRSAKGSVFHRCAMAESDPAYPKYPRLPVIRCAGYMMDTHTFDDGLTIRPATAGDVGAILSFIRQLADYEHLLDHVHATEERLAASLFGAHPAAEVLLAVDHRGPIGFALFFHNYSTFLASRGVYLEDLFVVPDARGRDVGRRLLSAVARIAVNRDCGRLDWAVLDWNELAIGFYHRMGATVLNDWRVCRLTGAALQTLAFPCG